MLANISRTNISRIHPIYSDTNCNIRLPISILLSYYTTSYVNADLSQTEWGSNHFLKQVSWHQVILYIIIVYSSSSIFNYFMSCRNIRIFVCGYVSLFTASLSLTYPNVSRALMNNLLRFCVFTVMLLGTLYPKSILLTTTTRSETFPINSHNSMNISFAPSDRRRMLCDQFCCPNHVCIF